jgi:hypothetical protein
VVVRSASGEGVRVVNTATTRPVVPPIDTSVGAGGSASVGYNAGTESTTKELRKRRRRYQNTKCKSSTISYSDPKYRAIEVSYGSYVKRT